MENVEIKRGSALELTLAFSNSDGSAYDLTGVSMWGEVRDARNVLVAQLTITPSETAGQATCTVADTSAWPQGLLRGAVMVLDGGLPTECQTFGINVLPSVAYSRPPQPNYDPVTSP